MVRNFDNVKISFQLSIDAAAAAVVSRNSMNVGVGCQLCNY